MDVCVCVCVEKAPPPQARRREDDQTFVVVRRRGGACVQALLSAERDKGGEKKGPPIISTCATRFFSNSFFGVFVGENVNSETIKARLIHISPVLSFQTDIFHARFDLMAVLC